jgi:hypothetical protein
MGLGVSSMVPKKKDSLCNSTRIDEKIFDLGRKKKKKKQSGVSHILQQS